jgi:hypothetical protein
MATKAVIVGMYDIDDDAPVTQWWAAIDRFKQALKVIPNRPNPDLYVAIQGDAEEIIALVELKRNPEGE